MTYEIRVHYKPAPVAEHLQSDQIARNDTLPLIILNIHMFTLGTRGTV